MDTIYALASARGKAGVAIVRISGPLACEGLLPFVGRFGEARRAYLRKLRHEGEVVDQALVIWFSEEASFTGEQVVELHLHGSTAIVGKVLAILDGIPGFRLAEPGEFTRRALMNGQLDLTQVEGLSDLIEAETEAQRRQAMKVFSGAIGQKVEGWRADLLRAAALLEAVLDFADEDVPVDVKPEVRSLMERVLADLRAEKAGFGAAERIRDGFEVAILGAPNAGKSTLLNRLAGREAAITSEFAGTTRDVIEVRMDLAGLPVTVLDTAGLRVAADPVEAIGIQRALDRAQSADLRVFLRGGDGDVPEIDLQPHDLVVEGKADLGQGQGLSVSGKTGAGVEQLVEKISSILSAQSANAATITRQRHRAAVSRAIEGLENAALMLSQPLAGEEIVAEALRSVIGDMNDLVGRIDVEDLLGEIFSSFCIGK